MSTIYPFYVFSSLIFLIFMYKWLSKHNHARSLKQPPSPPKLPIIGNLHQLDKVLHRCLHTLSRQYGDVMMLYFGNRPTIVISSADAAEEIMKKHDLVFANRPKQKYTTKIFYDQKELIFSPYNEQWRYLKNICMVQLLSNKKIQSYRALREEEIDLMLEKIKSYGGFLPFNLSDMTQKLTSDLICRTAFGRKYTGDDGSVDLYQIMKELMNVLVTVSVGDYIPWLGWVDNLTGLEARAKNVIKHFDEFIESVIQEHLICPDTKHAIGEEGNEEKNKTFVDILLEIHRQNPNDLPTESVKGIILDLFVGGTDTSHQALDWAMVELIRNPEIMKKLQLEVREIVKPKARVNEDDLTNMKYLKAVVKETLRLHPPAPLLLFRESSQAVRIAGYDIAARSQVIVNAWAIQRDPATWEDPEEFRPERFLNSSIDFRGQQFCYVPFGAGRRSCPGYSYALTLVELVLANLVNEFDWKLAGDAKSETLDMSEDVGITLSLKNPVSYIAIPAC